MHEKYARKFLDGISRACCSGLEGYLDGEHCLKLVFELRPDLVVVDVEHLDRDHPKLGNIDCFPNHSRGAAPDDTNESNVFGCDPLSNKVAAAGAVAVITVCNVKIMICERIAS